MSSSNKRKAGSQGAGGDAKKPRQNATITSFFSAPKPGGGSGSGSAKSGAQASSASASAPALSKFNKAEWVASLTPEQRTLLKLEIDTLDESWLAHLKQEVTSKEFLELKKFLDRETAAGKKWFPPKEDVYSWYVSSPLGS
jgi:uracil-DNA glycosylase